MAETTTIDFVLDDFEVSLNALGGTLFEGVSLELTTDAEVKLDVSLTNVNIFKFITEDLSLADEVDNNDLEYYVTETDLTTRIGNIFTDYTVIDGEMSAQGTQDVAHDYVRYLAFKLFNTVKGVDLFNNEAEMYTYFDTSMNDEVHAHITTTLQAAGTQLAPLTNNDNDDNVSKKLLEQVLAFDRSRLTEIGNDATVVTKEGDDELHALVPLREGDTISFKVIVNAADGQKALTGVSVIEPRSYKVKINIVDDGQQGGQQGGQQ